ncbi:DUF3139 domain-containing protein [Sporolactobacillus sp. CPB3-1]|uniref:DUF3139 domain-containing protein n=1 Tax=Sporolactobacillus mangiferae TaxID=2940498 RepID=A0ABT0M7S0_9BACL|nr:DUF3139 domain-containing protein [Sporolactobacillus mangiferae]MCL1630917.1 DUF3139 domain-containing protein [Sporolactobacillus mangiferae]
MNHVKRFLILFLMLTLYFFTLNNYIGVDSFIDLFSSMLAATIIFTLLFLLINGLTIYFYRSLRQCWKWLIVLLFSALPYVNWLYVYPWTAVQTYPSFINYLARQGLSTADITGYRAFPDLKMGGYNYEVQFKKDSKYAYSYYLDGREFLIFTAFKDNDFRDYKDAKIREVYNEKEYMQLKKDSLTDAKDYRKWTKDPVSGNIQQQKRHESQKHPIGLYRSKNLE